MRHFVFVPCRTELLHVHGEDVETIGVALLRMAAHQLLSDADTQHWLGERTDDFVKPMLTQVTHRLAGFALSGEQHLVC